MPEGPLLPEALIPEALLPEPGQLQSLLRELEDGLGQMQISLDDHQKQTLLGYLQLLSKWNRVHNLTAVRDMQQMVSRHLLDSLSILPFVDGDSLTDVGTGAGLPGIPLAVAKPHMNVTLVDCVAKKTRFIEHASSQLRIANVKVEHARVENLHLQSELVVARAFASVDKLALLSSHLLPVGGRLLALVGHVPAVKILENIAGFSVLEVAGLTIPGETAERNIVVLQRDQTQAPSQA